MQLHSPWALLLLLFLPVAAYLLLKKRRTAAVRFSSVGDMSARHVSWRLRFRPVLVVLRLLCLALLIIALARPRKGTVLEETSTEGVAIEVVVDRSGSMEAEMDYKGRTLNRLEVVKKVFEDFIQGESKDFAGRSGDLIGLVTFARYADTTCPLVLSHNVLLEFMRNTEIVKVRSENATAIGDAVGLSAARLKKAEEQIEQRKAKLGLGGEEKKLSESEKPDFEIKSKVIVLLTDGENNAGEVQPMGAAELAKQWGIKIYTIGIGGGQQFTTIQTPLGSYKMPVRQQLDERLLKAMAETTGGFYGRASDADALQEIVKRIDQLEKTEVKAVQYTQYAERFGGCALIALILLGAEILGRCTIFRKVP